MKPFRQIAHGSIKCHTLREEVGTYGYALIRDLLPTGEIESVLTEIATVLQAAGWIDSSTNPIERRAVLAAARASGDPAYREVNHRVFALESFHRFPHHPALQDVMKSVVGAELFIHPRSAARLIFPNFDRGVIHAHQDHTAVAGDSESFTAWIPLHDCPLEMGPLRILEGSHRFGVQATEGETGYIRPGTERVSAGAKIPIVPFEKSPTLGG